MRGGLLITLAVLASTSLACGGPFDAKAQASTLGSTRSPQDAHALSDDARRPAPRPLLAREPFALVRLAPALDVFGPLPNLPFPIDVHIARGVEDRVVADQPVRRRTMKIQLPGSYERFDAEVGDRVISALAVPTGAAIVFRYGVMFGTGSYEGVSVYAEPLATTGDLVRAEVIPYGTDEAPVKTNLVALQVNLSEDASRRLSETNAEDGVVWLLDGRVVRKDDRLGKVSGRRLVFEWSDPSEALAVANKLVARVAAGAPAVKP